MKFVKISKTNNAELVKDLFTALDSVLSVGRNYYEMSKPEIKLALEMAVSKITDKYRLNK